MGQQTSLNCKSSQKPQQHEFETTQTHAIQLIKSQNKKNDSDIKSKQSTFGVSQVVSFTPFQNNNASIKNTQVMPAQHENILKVSAWPFEGAEKIGNRYVEKGNKCLAEIIEERYNSNMYFPQAQVVSLIESLVYSLAYMQQFQFNHHDFYPTNIYYSNGIFKITNPLIVQTSAYALTQQRKRFSFLSPEQISDILQEVPESQISIDVIFKSDIFSIGMIVLEFCTLQPSAQCYDQESYSLVDKTIKERLIKVQSLYSPMIADCIAEMLRYEVEERIGVSELSLLVFLNSNNEKIPKETEQQEIRNINKAPPVGVNSPKPYQLNPPHVQPQYLILSPGQLPPSINLPPGQGLPLNSNSIAISTPNYAYSRIGPNNQSLMSSATLQNKLRVIELIHQNPKEEQQTQEHFHPFSSNMVPTNVSPQKPFIHSFSQNSYQSDPKQQFPESQPYMYNPQARIQQPKRQYSSEKKKYYDEQIKPNIQKYINDEFYQERTKISNSYSAINSSDNNSARKMPSSTSFVSSRNRAVDQNGQTLQQRVERILQMSRSIK